MIREIRHNDVNCTNQIACQITAEAEGETGRLRAGWSEIRRNGGAQVSGRSMQTRKVVSSQSTDMVP